ncbi:MAG: RraA family protein [Alphaproteobacteria bacterium]
MVDQTQDAVARLRLLDSCAVSDALDSLNLPAAVTGIQRLATDKAIAGRVMTVKLGTEKRDDGPPRHLGTAAVEAAEPGDILVIEQLTGINAAGWGGVLSNAAQVKGIAGIIVEGPARDIEESRELGFPVFARSATARTARGRIFEVDFNGDITVGDVTVAPGDLVIADASAVVFVPAARADEVLAAAERITEKERLMTVAVRRGDPVSQVMGADYERMLNQADKA